jgi:hypothetical protein
MPAPDPAEEDRKPKLRASALTPVALALAIGALEFVHPLCFSDDDNRDMNLPPLV